jgi:hypothetical protein
LGKSTQISTKVSDFLKSKKAEIQSLLNKEFDKILKIKPKELNPANLPPIFAYSYLAALFFIIGQALYQFFAPEDIRRFSLEKYQEYRRTSYRQNPSIEAFNDYKEKICRDYGTHKNTFSQLFGKIEREQANDKAADLLKSEEAFNLVSIVAKEDYIKKEVDVIVGIVASGVCYFLSIVSILTVFIYQSLSVFREVGII